MPLNELIYKIEQQRCRKDGKHAKSTFENWQ